MKIIQSAKIRDVITLQPEIFYDHRGENVETFYSEAFKSNCKRFGIPELDFKVDSFSFSKKNVLRGFHGDNKTWKLVQCLQGEIQLAIIDIRENSATVNAVETFFLNDRNRFQVLIPAGCVNAHLCLSDTCIFAYKLSYHYVRQDEQLHVKWNDVRYNLYWPIQNPILSKRDS